MAKSISLHIGLNSVDHAHYGGWSGKLRACENDARDMSMLATRYGYSPKLILTKKATRHNIITAIKSIAKSKPTNFILTYSGHGGQLPDKNHDEIDKKDETWCLYDGQLIDDELFNLLTQFPTSTKICVISDSCHSGTMIKGGYYWGSGFPEEMQRAMPYLLVDRVYKDNESFYSEIMPRKPAKKNDNIILLSGCQDNQYSMDGIKNGVFTATLLDVWKHGIFKGTYRQLHRAIVRRMPPTQTPNLYTTGDNKLLDTPIFV